FPEFVTAGEFWRATPGAGGEWIVDRIHGQKSMRLFAELQDSCKTPNLCIIKSSDGLLVRQARAGLTFGAPGRRVSPGYGLAFRRAFHPIRQHRGLVVRHLEETAAH